MKAKPILWIMAMAGNFLHAQQAPSSPDAPAEMMIRYEVFSVDPTAAAAIRREKPADPAFYERLIGRLETGDVIQEEFVVMRSMSGQKSKSESIRELIYPTEYEPARIAPVPASAKRELSDMVVPAAATAFETRNCGVTVELEAIIGESRQWAELNINPDHTGFTERVKWGRQTSETEMPLFETQRVTSIVAARVGTPLLLGTVNPPVDSKLNASRIWFAFVTVNLTKK